MRLFLSLLLDLVYLIVSALALPWFVYRVACRGDARGLLPRFGVGLGAGADSSVWLHGASAGEVLLLQPLVRRLERDYPGTPLVVSAFSPSGLAAARRVFPRHRVVAFPFDFSALVHRFLRHFQPRLVVVVEGDLWPGFLLALRRREIPVVVLNGRMSARSRRRHALGRIVPSLMREMPFIAVQTEEHARRFERLGVEPGRVHVTGNMKYDLTPPPSEPGETLALRERLGYRDRDVVIIGGSLHRGEDEALLRAWRHAASRETQARAALVLAPRYPADAARVERNVREHGARGHLKTAVDGGEAPPGADGVLIVDTLGELRALYAAADVAFVGGSLFSRGRRQGGHNLMEPAIAGVPVLFGPCHFNFVETAEALLEAGAGAVVHDWEELARRLRRLLEDEPERRRMGARGRAVIRSRQGATQRNYALLRPLLGAETSERTPSAAIAAAAPRPALGPDSR